MTHRESFTDRLTLALQTGRHFGFIRAYGVGQVNKFMAACRNIGLEFAIVDVNTVRWLTVEKLQEFDAVLFDDVLAEEGAHELLEALLAVPELKTTVAVRGVDFPEGFARA